MVSGIRYPRHRGIWLIAMVIWLAIAVVGLLGLIDVRIPAGLMLVGGLVSHRDVRRHGAATLADRMPRSRCRSSGRTLMLLLLARDMQWRWRRLAAGVLATALVLAMTLLLGALRESFLAETDRAVAFFGADVWIAPDDTRRTVHVELADRGIRRR